MVRKTTSRRSTAKPKSLKSKAKSRAKGDSARILLSVYDGGRAPISGSVEMLVRVRDGQQKEWISRSVKGPVVVCQVPFSNNFKDRYTVLVSADNHRDAGFFPVNVTPALDQSVSLMLLRKAADFKFADWEVLTRDHPKISSFLSCGLDQSEAEANYQNLRTQKPASLAALLNLTAAMSAIQLPENTPLEYFKQILWDESMAQDRFFAYVDRRLLDQVRTAAAQGLFAPEPSPGLFHPDATCSFKQIQFGEANFQLTFHEGNRKTIGKTECIKVEPDMDYYKDIGAHAILEVIPNSLLHRLSDPKIIYVLRWIAGKHAGIPEFNPGYTLV